MDPRRRELVLEGPRGPRKGGVNVAMRLEDVPLMIRVQHRAALAPPLEEPVARRVGVQDRRVGAEGLVHIEQRGQLLVLDRYQADGLVGDLARIRGDRRHAIADEQDAIPAEHRPVLEPPAEALAPDVRAREHRAHAGEGPRPSGVDRDDARVRVGAPHEGSLQGAGYFEVSGVLRRTGRLLVAVETPLRPIEDRRRRHRAATVRRRHSANPARTLSACRAMSGCPSSPMRPRIATSLAIASSVGASPVTTRSTNARTAPPIR